ncbi:MAG: response regulator [Alphaproteobacteria bacterium]|nr:response regulator [Alphaproteobacteria bacterium]
MAARLDIGADLALFEKLTSSGEPVLVDSAVGRWIGLRLPLSVDSGLHYSVYLGIPEKIAIGRAAENLRRNMTVLGFLLAGLAVSIAYMVKLRTEIRLRKRTEAAMKQVSEQLSVALEHMPGGIVMVDHDSNLRAYNQRYVDFYHLPQPRIGMSLSEIMTFRARCGDYGPGDPGELVIKRLAGYKALEPRLIMDRTPDGRIIELLRSPTPEGGIVAILSDVTERKLAEAELQRSEFALENAAAPIIWCDRHGHVFPANRMAYEQLGYASGGLIGCDVQKLIAIADAKLWEGIWNVVKTRTRDMPGEQVFTRADGRTFAAETLSKYIAFGGHEYICTFFRNITRRKQVEKEIREAKEAAEEATKAKSSFLAMMSHAIRTPMNGVMSMAEMLGQTELTAAQRSMSSVIRASAQALLTIIKDILDFSKIEAGKLDIESVPFSPIDVVEGAGELVAARAEDKAIGMVIDLDPAMPNNLIGDPTWIRQILLNLMGNAVKFTDRGRTVLRVNAVGESDADRRRLRFEIIDTGIGLTAEQRGKLFQPFVQADSSTARKYGDTGLGLSICHRLTEMMGGTIGVEFEPGQGSTFWFELPLKLADSNLLAPEPAIGDARIVAIGFEGAVRTAPSRMLAGAGIADTGWIGLEGDVMATLRAHHPSALSVVLVDAGGGSGMGLEACRRILTGAGLENNKVILGASRGQASTLAEADRIGLFATLTLPLRRQRLWHTLAAALGRAELAVEQAVTVSEDIGWAPPTAQEAGAAGALILVAEDNTTNQVVIKRLLDQCGYANEIADHGAIALKRYRPGVHGLLLTDFHMPEMDGFQLIAEIRKAETDSGRRVPIVALTADALPGTEQKCLDAGMDGYLTKPIDSKALTAALEKHLPQAKTLRRRPAATPAAIPATPILPDVDPQILDVKRLAETFGSFDGAARDFLKGFVADVPPLITAVEQALSAQESRRARDAAHALKGAARSTGAVRLGQLASDIQDCLDGDDADTAGMLAGLLGQTYDELRSVAATLAA